MLPLTHQFRQALAQAQYIVVLTGAGVSAESGIPTFRGAAGLWRNFDPLELGAPCCWRCLCCWVAGAPAHPPRATPQAFVRRPSLVWEFYSWRRDVAACCRPNKAHYAIAALQQRLERDGRRLTLLTQNVDRLHQAAGSTGAVELHGSIWDVCRARRNGLKAGPCWEDRLQPLVAALAGRGQPDGDASPEADIPLEQLPHDAEGLLLRPGVVWFNENLDPAVLEAAQAATDSCDMFITAGTSAVVYPAAGYAQQAAARGVPVAEFCLECTPATGLCRFAFQGKAGELLPAAFDVEAEVQQMMQADG